jgi:H+/Cl- antiporter ClcA
MRTNRFRFEQLKVLPQLLKWFVLASVIGFLAGVSSTVFLWSLDKVTDWREAHVWVIAFLPLAGLGIGWAYHTWGKSVEGGNNLVIDEIHDPKATIPLRMTPLILISSVVTHLFGGSAGREGTAIQMSASLADQVCKVLGLSTEDRRTLLMAGISGGFAAVFGTPLAGTFFGLEVLAIGQLRYEAIFPCLVAAIVGDYVTLFLGIHHTLYRIPLSPEISISGLCWAVLSGAIFGIVSMGFGGALRTVSRFYKEKIPSAPWRPFVGGIIVAGLVYLLHSTRYIGLGIPVIRDAFMQLLPPWDFAMKFLMTLLTLGSGFKGGEVTPLFFIGATLGNALSRVIALPMPLLAGMGFTAVFAGATNTPLACTLMGIELFGHESALYMAIACIVSYLFSGHTGIYHAQRVESRK